MTLLDKTNTLVVVPAYNEQESIVAVIEEIKATGFPFVVIDDGSTDETRNQAVTAGARAISLPFNAGVGGALKCGFQFAICHGYSAVIQCDADGQHSTEHFQSLINHAVKNSAHLVIGTRFAGVQGSMKVGKFRKVAIQAMSLAINRKYKIGLSDTTSGFRLISEPLLGQYAKRFPLYYLGDTFEAIKMAASSRYVVIEVPVPFSNRTHGASSASNLQAMSNIFKVICISILGIQFKIDKNMNEICSTSEKRERIAVKSDRAECN